MAPRFLAEEAAWRVDLGEQEEGSLVWAQGAVRTRGRARLRGKPRADLSWPFWHVRIWGSIPWAMASLQRRFCLAVQKRFYALNVRVPLQFVCGNPNLQRDGIWRSGLGRSLGHELGAP